MKKKVIVSLIIIIMMIMCTFQYSYADTAGTDMKYYYKNETLGILAYKQVNAFKVSLSDRSTLADAIIDTNSSSNIIENIKPVEIVLVLDNSNSMSNRMVSLINFSKNLVESLFKTIGKDNLKIGLISFNQSIKNHTGGLTNDEDTIYNFINGMRASGNTHMSDAVDVAKSWLTNENEEETLKFICTLTDGYLQDKDTALAHLIQCHTRGFKTKSIFVGTRETFSEENFRAASENTTIPYQNFLMHKNYYTESINDELVKDIYSDIYTEIINLSPPKTKYKINNAAIIPGDDKIIIQADEEIMHGAILEIEYDITFFSSSDMKIKIKDLYSSPLVFNENQKMLTENKTNKQYGWKMKDTDGDGKGELINDGPDNTGIETKKGEEYKVKLVLSTVLTPTVLGNLDVIGNSIDIEFAYGEDDEGNDIWGGNRIDGTPGNSGINIDIKSLDILIIPPTGTNDVRNRVEWTLNMIVAITSILLIIVCIIDYLKERRKK